MSPAGYPALFFTVVLLVTTFYFILGGLPLLILQHDTPVDAKFVRRFFEIYYKAEMVAAIGACASYALWGRATLAIGAALIAIVAVVLRLRILPAMERLGSQIQADPGGAIRAFRQVHSAALVINAMQLVALVWGVTKITL